MTAAAASWPGMRARDLPDGRAWPAVTSIRSARPDLVGIGFSVFGTFGALLITDQPALPVARRILSAELAAIDRACSRFRPDSELTALNRAGDGEHAVSPLLAESLAVALRAAAATAGDVDPTCGSSLVSLGYDRDFAQLSHDELSGSGPSHSELSRSESSGSDRGPLPSRLPPSQLLTPVPAGGWRHVQLDQEAGIVRVPAGVQFDLGATAKALAADRAAAAIAAATGAGVLVNLGGDIAVAGPAPESGWRVQVTDDLPGPAATDRASRRRGPVIAIRDGGLATSGTATRRWQRGGQQLHHIVDPATGRPAASCWAAVSVAGASCVDANTASTAAIIRSSAAPGWLDSLGMPARLVRADGTVVRTGGWPDEF